MKKLGRTLRVGFVVGLIFFGWYMRDFLYQGGNPKGWHFKLFSWTHWSYVWNEFKSGWVISAKSDWIFLLSVVIMIPIFLLLWWVSVKISWRKSFMTVLRQIKNFFFKPSAKQIIRKKIKLKTKASHKKVRPAPMVTIGRPAAKQTGRTMDAEKFATPVNSSAEDNIASMPQTSFQPAVGVPKPTFEMGTNPFAEEETAQSLPLDENISNIPLDSIQLPERIRLEEDLVGILSAANYQVIQDATIGKLKVSYVGVSENTVVLCLTDAEKGDWLADEEFFNEEEPLWFSESSHRISPVYALLTAAKGFAKKGTEKGLTQEVVPILIEKDGTIINAGDMLETWRKMGVLVCRTDLGGPEELPSFGAVLPKASDKGEPALVEAVQALF